MCVEGNLSLVIFQRGRTGFGMREEFRQDQDCVEWRERIRNVIGLCADRISQSLGNSIQEIVSKSSRVQIFLWRGWVIFFDAYNNDKS